MFLLMAQADVTRYEHGATRIHRMKRAARLDPQALVASQLTTRGCGLRRNWDVATALA